MCGQFEVCVVHSVLCMAWCTGSDVRNMIWDMCGVLWCIVVCRSMCVGQSVSCE